MKTILLLRHAKSSWAKPGISDHERPLNERGKTDAPRVGHLLRTQQLTPDVIASSSAKRARKTAQKVAAACGYAGEIELLESLYLAPAARYLEYLQHVADAHQRVLVVGHNPGLEELLEALTGLHEHLPTATLARVDLSIRRWAEVRTAAPGQLVHLWRLKELP